MILQSIIHSGWWQTLGILSFAVVIAIAGNGLVGKAEKVKVEGVYLSPEERMQFYR